MEKNIFICTYKDYGLNGDQTDEESYEFVEINVVASSIEDSVKVLRSNLPKSLVYDVVYVQKSENKLILS